MPRLSELPRTWDGRLKYGPRDVRPYDYGNSNYGLSAKQIAKKLARKNAEFNKWFSAQPRKKRLGGPVKVKASKGKKAYTRAKPKRK